MAFRFFCTTITLPYFQCSSAIFTDHSVRLFMINTFQTQSLIKDALLVNDILKYYF